MEVSGSVKPWPRFTLGEKTPGTRWTLVVCNGTYTNCNVYNSYEFTFLAFEAANQTRRCKCTGNSQVQVYR